MKRGFILSGVAVAALSIGGGFAAAQETGDDGAVVLDTVTVTGFRAQNRDSIASKQNAETVADFITADVIGRQPDINLADSLRRLPGVTTEFDEDEGRFVSIRGLPGRYSYIALNGVYIPDGWFATDRRQSIESIPSFAVRRAGVYKALTPDLEGNAIGGYVENDLHSAFDRDGTYITGRVSLGFHNTDTPGGEGDPSYKADARFSTQFGENDQFGVLLAGSFFQKNRDQSKSLRDWRYESDDTPYVGRIEVIDYTNSIDRWSLLGRLEWQPTSDFYTAISASHFDYQYDEYRYFTRIDGRGARTVTPEGGSYARGRAELILDKFPIGTENDFLTWEVDWDLSEERNLSGSLSYASGKYELDHLANSINFRTGDLDALGYSWDTTGQSEGDRRLAPITFNDASALTDPGNYNFIGDFWRRGDFQEQNISQAKIDYKFEPVDGGLGYKAGGLFRNMEVNVDFDRDAFWSLADGVTLTPEQFVTTNYTNPESGITHLILDPDAFVAFFQANPDLFELDRRDSVVPAGLETVRGDLTYDEDILAAYGMLTWEGNNLKLRGGLRVEATEFDTSAYNRTTNAPVTYSGDYTDVLPSFVGSYGLSDELILRFGYAKAIGRPNPDDIAKQQTESEDGEGVIFVSRGNPELEPRRADNFDLSLEWYFTEGGLLSLGYFFKDIENEIYTQRDEQIIDGIEYVFTQPLNAASADVQGLELTFNYDKFDFVEGFFSDFGFTSNVTWFDGEFEVRNTAGDTRIADRLPGSAEWRANASLLYQNGPVEGRLTYAYTGERRVNVNTGNVLEDRFEEAFNQLDFQVRYNVTDNIQAFVEGRNITGESRLFSEGNADFFREDNDFGSAYFVGATFSY